MNEHVNPRIKPPSQPSSTLDQKYSARRQEGVNTSRIAAELLTSQNTTQLIADFDEGVTSLRDVGRMLTVQRTAILKAWEDGTIHNKTTFPSEILSIPVQNLHERVVSGAQDQVVGHNFFVNAAGFLAAGLPWARQLDALLQNRLGVSIYDIAKRDNTLRDNTLDKDALLAAITENPDSELTTALAIYLAGRSLEGEKYLEQHYGEVLERTKGQVYATIQAIGATTGLPLDMLERAAQQLQRTTFGSFDHLAGLVTSDNSGAAGDYRIGSLRLEVQFDGNIHSARLRIGPDAYHVVAHELHHASSAQTQEKYRCGLQINGEGLEANEGMTEYLAQLSVGSPGIEQLADGDLRIREDVPYRVPVIAMLALHKQFEAGKNNHFAILFNAYHGDVSSQSQLKQALDAFYQIYATLY